MVEDTRKRQLLQILREGEDTDAEVQRQAQGIVQEAQLARDIRKVFYGAVKIIPDDSVFTSGEWDHFASSYRAQKAAAVDLLARLNQRPRYDVASSTNATSTVVSVLTAELRPSRQTVFPSLRQAAADMTTILAREPLVEKVADGIRRTKLDIARGRIRSPLDIIEDSRAALTRPAGDTTSAVAVLIPIREAIENVIEQLLKRRKTQEPTKGVKDKIESIGAQCGIAGLASDHFTRLGEDVAAMLTLLSDSKQKELTREQITGLFSAALQSLRSILDSVDQERFRGAIVPLRRAGL